MENVIKRDEVHLSLNFINNDVQLPKRQKQLGSVLDFKLNFNEHVNNKTNKCNKSISNMKKFFRPFQNMVCWPFRTLLPRLFFVMQM